MPPAVLGHVGDPERDRGGRGVDADRLAAEADFARIGRGEAEQDAGQFRAAGPDEPGEPEDLAGPHRE